tara:strand:- start:579 stop:1349 length:771 start_codon:yes stop_codon:yes gene_type:complete
MKDNLKISIITVAFNSAKTIRDTISSIIKQDYKNVEYIVIDGNSTDETNLIVSEFKENVDVHVSENDKGIYDAMNKGIKLATGDVIGILNSDDFYPNSYILSNVIKTFNMNKCEAVYGDLVYVNAQNTSKIKRYWQSGPYTTKKLKNGWMLPHPTFFVKSSIYKKFGLYNTSLHMAADYDMIIRLLYKFNISAKYIPMILVKMRVGGASNASIIDRLRANKEDGLAWTKNQLNKPYFIRIKKPLQKIKQFFQKPEI